MPHAPTSTSSWRGPRVLLALALVTLVVLGAWWAARTRANRAMDQALAPFAAAGLPALDAPVDPALAELGAQLFERRCAACHGIRGEPRLGPDLGGVTERREAAWILAMIQRPDSMVEHDPVARALKAEYPGVQMLVAGGMDPARTRAVLDFLRRADEGAGGR